MPKGKGTYGSQVGRPSKKNKYQAGGMIDPFSQKNPEGLLVQEALETKADLGESSDIPMEDARGRSESYQLGGMIDPSSAPSITPTPQYEKGGKIKKLEEKVLKGKGKDITDIVKAVNKKRKKKKAAQEAQWKEYTPFGPKFKKEVG
jgi:hypothetical protein